jgi:hypothetical protein
MAPRPKPLSEHRAAKRSDEREVGSGLRTTRQHRTQHASQCSFFPTRDETRRRPAAPLQAGSNHDVSMDSEPHATHAACTGMTGEKSIVVSR